MRFVFPHCPRFGRARHGRTSSLGTPRLFRIWQRPPSLWPQLWRLLFLRPRQIYGGTPPFQGRGLRSDRRPIRAGIVLAPATQKKSRNFLTTQNLFVTVLDR